MEWLIVKRFLASEERICCIFKGSIKSSTKLVSLDAESAGKKMAQSADEALDQISFKFPHEREIPEERTGKSELYIGLTDREVIQFYRSYYYERQRIKESKEIQARHQLNQNAR